jgi:hypothetical protein
MGMDVKLDLNANISKLQLGCGGVNDLLTGARGCDLDIDYVGFMGLNGTKDRPGIAGSPFTLTRPFIEIAFKNDNNAAKREVVGFRIGAQNINGAIRMGRDYTNTGFSDERTDNISIPNLENGDICNPSASTGAGVVGCHSGLNTISGYLAGLELSAGFDASVKICDPLAFCDKTGPTTWDTSCSIFDLTCADPITAYVKGCLGRIGYSPCSTSDTPFFIDAGGTRLSVLDVAAAKLKLKIQDASGNNIPLLSGISVEGYGELRLNTRQVHYLLAPDSSDFFLSFQRERVSWPRYTKTTPAADYTAAGYPSTDIRHYNSCNSSWGQDGARCYSAYSPTANTGWWLSAANAKLLNLLPGDRIDVPELQTLGGLATAAFSANSSPLIIENPKLGFIAADNCYGSARFC